MGEHEVRPNEGGFEVNWEELWPIIWPILKEALVAALIAILALLGYDRYVPSRYARKSKDKEV